MRHLNRFSDRAVSPLALAAATALLAAPAHAVTFTAFSLFHERGFNSDLQVQALDAVNHVIGTYTILRANYANTGIVVSTDNGAFLNNGQALGSIGLRSDQPISRLRLSSYQSDVLSFNGPDDKVLAVSAVPEPGSAAVWLAGLGGLGWLARQRTPAPR